MITAQKRSFRVEWEYEFLFVDRQGIPQCLVCRSMLSIMKRFNLKRHYETFHKREYENIVGAARDEIIKNLKKMLATKVKRVKAIPIEKQEFIETDDDFDLEVGGSEGEVPLNESEMKDFEQILVTSSSCCAKCEKNDRKATMYLDEYSKVEQQNKVLEAKLKETQSKLAASTTSGLTSEERLVQILGEDNEKKTAVADTCFLLSLTPSLATMTESEKSSLKIQFLQAIVNVQTGRRQQTSAVSQSSFRGSSTSQTTTTLNQQHGQNRTSNLEDDHFIFKYENDIS